MRLASHVVQADLHIARSVAIDIDLQRVAARAGVQPKRGSLVAAEEIKASHILDVASGHAEGRKVKAVAGCIEIVNDIGGTLRAVREAD